MAANDQRPRKLPIKPPNMTPQVKWNAWYFVAAIFGIMLLQQVWVTQRQTASIPYSDFKTYVREGRIAEISVANQYIYGTTKEPLPGGKSRFVTARVDEALSKELEGTGVKISGVVEDTWLSDILSWVLPVLLFFGIWYFVFRRIAAQGGLGAGGFMSVGKSKAKVYVENDTKTSFEDVAGVDEAKEELQEVVGFLKDPQRYGRLGGRVPKGVLLVGPPGTGKTLLARAVAGEAGVPFFSISGSEFVEMFVGVGAARVRDLFEQARQKAPAIIFIDELDALGRARNAGGPFAGGHDEKEQTLNQLLVELDGFDSKAGLVLLAATNRPEILDPALLRAGRFDRQVLVDRPDKPGRIQILNVHMKKAKIATDVDAEKIAALTPGFTGADLANLVNEAALVATRRNADAVTLADFTAAIERIIAGLEKRNRLLNAHERQVVAWHEMGHALAALSLPGVDTVHKVSIIPRGIGALGYTIQRPTEDRFLMTREELENKMMVLLAGRGAELIAFGRFSTGASDDLQKVTDIARSMITRYGMSDRLGNVTYERDSRNFLGGPGGAGYQEKTYSEATARDIDDEVRQIVDEAFHRTLDLLRSRHDVLEKGARQLLEKETLNEEELLELVGSVPPTPLATAAE